SWTMKKDASTILAFLLVVYPLVVAAANLTQEYVIFQSRGVYSPPPRGMAIDTLELTTPDGERLQAWWLRTPHACRTVLYFQENGTNISHRTSRLKTLQKMGVDALLIDYRGYGNSTGRIRTEQDIYTDGMTAWNFLTVENGIDPRTIIIWGRSLGGGVAAEIAQAKPIAALVLEATFSSLDDLARRRYWFLPIGSFLKFHFANGAKLDKVTAPTIIIHSRDDDYIPFSQAIKLYEAATGEKYLLKSAGSHLDRFDTQEALVAVLMHRLGLETCCRPPTAT
ncbi:MAG TPA: alpha/beta hydrolase, partial [Desulfosarcina sp.]|nr:alpha/beta hydrolase [Desulfosarcina sp.]